LILQQSALTNNKEATKEYTIEMAKVIVKVVSLMCMGVQQKSSKKGHQFIQTFNLSKGLQEFGKRGEHAAMKEMKQLHERMVFEPINIENLTSLERKRAMESLIP
jgi:hypothetical protein